MKKLPILKVSTKLLLLLAIGTTSCSSNRTRPAEGYFPVQSDLKDSSIDIQYVLGHAHRRFLATAEHSGYTAQAFHDRQILKEGQVDSAHYSEFFSKANSFISTPHRVPAVQSNPEEDCRSPFKVTVRVGAETKVFQGCRNADEGALSHLVRDGEFLLLHSKK